MKKIFVSYRRAESEDFCGRLVDRLAGYFGRERISMDVDNLISGEGYREQIAEIIDESDIVLAIIGPQWLPMENYRGERRIDDPEDQLRIELETARQLNKTIIPILIHDADLPQEDQLPESLHWLAHLQAIPIASGQSFNVDLKLFIERLEHQYRMRNPDRRFPLELILIPLGIAIIVVGFVFALNAPYIQPYLQGHMSPTPITLPSLRTGWLVTPSLKEYRADVLSFICYAACPLVIGPVLIVTGKRYCCLTQETQSRLSHYASGLGRRRTPKSTWSVICLAMGVAAFGLGFLAILPVLVLVAVTLWDVKRRKGWIRGRSLAASAVVVLLIALPISGTWQYQTWQNDRWLMHYDQGIESLNEENMAEAAQAFKKAADDHSTSDLERNLALLRYAEVSCEMGDYSDVITAAREITREPPPEIYDPMATPTSLYALATNLLAKARKLNGEELQPGDAGFEEVPNWDVMSIDPYPVTPLFETGEPQPAEPPPPFFVPPAPAAQ